jgi:RNA polymerase sigma-70 factor (ECF subfamily)
MTFAGTFALATASAQQNAQTRPARAVESHPPVVVKTVPEAGATDVDPTLTEIRVTFSKEMTDGNWAFARVNPESYPQTTGRPRYLEDKRTCVLPVKLEPGKGYVIWLNRPPYDSFMDTGKRKAVSYLLTFETKAP